MGSILSHILLPVTMVCVAVTGITSNLACDWSNPDGSETHTLDVVQLLSRQHPSLPLNPAN